MTTPLKVLDLCVHTEHSLRRGRVYDVETLQNMDTEQVLAIPNIGRKKLSEINNALIKWEHSGAIKADRKALKEVPLSDAALIEELQKRGYVVIRGSVISAQGAIAEATVEITT